MDAKIVLSEGEAVGEVTASTSASTLEIDGLESSEDCACESNDRLGCSWIQVKNSIYCQIGTCKFYLQDRLDTSVFAPSSRVFLSVCSRCSKLRLNLRCDKKSSKKKTTKSICVAVTNYVPVIENLRHTTRIFDCAITPFDASLQLTVFLKNSALCDASIYGIHSPLLRDNIVSIMAHFFPALIDLPQPAIAWKKEDCFLFLKNVKEKRKEVTNWNLNTDKLVPTLRPYQEDATRFMISREVFPSLESPMDSYYVSIPTKPSFLFYPATAGMALSRIVDFKSRPGGILADEMGLGKTVEIIALALTHERGSKIVSERKTALKTDVIKTIVDELVSTVVACLATQSMPLQVTNRSKRAMYYCDTEWETECRNAKKICPGLQPPLTKMVTCASCGLVCRQDRVFWDKFPSCDVRFQCPECIYESEELLSVDTTLIIAPSTICRQWYEELKRHVRDDVRVDLYRGVALEGYKHPAFLARQNFVICSFETLRSEIRFIEDGRRDRRTLRRKKALYAPSPLISVEWWRICLDEAQVVEGASNAAYKMCQKLCAINKWCVTGTPLKDSLFSLFGFLSFIGVEPYCYKNWFYHALWAPHTNGNSSNLVNLFAQLLWRNTKDDVADQLCAPAKAKDVTALYLSPFEEQLYRGLFVGRFGSKIAALRSSLSDMSLDTCISELHGDMFNRIMEPLQKARRLIVLPGLQFTKVRQNLSSKEQFQEELFKRTAAEIEKTQRDLMFHLNGIAGLYWLLEQYSDARLHYDRALESVEALELENEKLGLPDQKFASRKLRSDRLQLIHALNGLIDLKEQHGVFDSGFDLETSKKRLKETVDEHMAQTLNALKLSREKITTLLSEKAEDLKELPSSISWLCVVGQTASDASVQRVFVDSMKTALLSYNRFEIKGRNIDGMNFLAVDYWDELVKNFGVLKKRTEFFAKPRFETVSVIEEIIRCHFLQNNECQKECTLCAYNSEIRNFESSLYYKTNEGSTLNSLEEERTKTAFEKSTSGLKFVSTLEVILRIFRQTMNRRTDMFPSEVMDLAARSFILIEFFKEFLQASKKLLFAVFDYAARSDELRQCKIRLSYDDQTPPQNTSELKHFFLCTPGTEKNEINCHEQSLAKTKCKHNMLLSKLRYISKLCHETAMDCPVCYERIQDAWLVFPCAHCVCGICFRSIKRIKFAKLVRCPVCRYDTDVSAISFVQNVCVSNAHHYMDSSAIVLKKDTSVKMNAIVRRILSIGQRDPTAKILLFTSLMDIILPICKDLTANDITFRNFAVSNKEKALAEFCSDPNIHVLVMPISSGARGLNLTVANHIIFVEPQLDARQLAQAIGRIDRIGQRRETMVHHFVIYGTIEEQIFNKVLDPKSEEWTVRSLTNLICNEYDRHR